LEEHLNPEGYTGIFIDIFPYDNCYLFFLPFQSSAINFGIKIFRIKNDEFILKKGKIKNIQNHK